MTSEVQYDPYKLPLRPVESGHGFMGTIGRTEDGEYLQCHICGGLYKSLGVHAAKKHGVGENEYRERFKLARQTPLVSEKARERYVLTFQKLSIEAQKRRLEALARARVQGSRAKTYYNKSLETKNREGRCPDQLIDKIQALAIILGHTPAMREFREYYGGYIGTIYQTFGSWSAAVKIAGLVEAPRGQGPKRYNRQALIAMIQNFTEVHGRRPYSSDVNAGLLPSAWTFTKYFGSWSNALKEAAR